MRCASLFNGCLRVSFPQRIGAGFALHKHTDDDISGDSKVICIKVDSHIVRPGMRILVNIGLILDHVFSTYL